MGIKKNFFVKDGSVEVEGVDPLTAGKTMREKVTVQEASAKARAKLVGAEDLVISKRRAKLAAKGK